MKNLNKKTIESFKEAGYSFEEIQRIDKSVESLNQGKGIPLSKVMYNLYSNKTDKKCIK